MAGTKTEPHDLPAPCGQLNGTIWCDETDLTDGTVSGDTKSGDAAADEALRRVFVNAPPMVSVPVAVYSLQMTTFIHQSQLRSTLGILRSTSFQCYLSLLRPLLFFSFAKELSFYCKYPSRLSAPFRVRVALQQGCL